MHSFFGHLLMMQQLHNGCMMQIAEIVNLFLETMNAKYSKDAGHAVFFIRFESTSTQIKYTLQFAFIVSKKNFLGHAKI